MMLFFDRYIDTRAKRYYGFMLLFLIVASIFSIPYALLGGILLQTDSYSSLFALLQQSVLLSCYVSRVVVDAMSITSQTVGNYLEVFLANLGVMEYAMILLLIFGYTMIKHNKKTAICVLLIITQLLVTAVLLMIALRSSSLSQAVTCIRLMGVVFIAGAGCMLVLLVRQIFTTWKHYHNALQYEVEELKE